MLEEPKLSTWDENAADLPESRGLVGNRVQHPCAHHRVRAAVLDGKVLGEAFHDLDRHRRVTGRSLRDLAQVWLGFHREHAGDGGGVGGEVRAAARADLDDLAGESGEQRGAMLGHPSRAMARAILG